METGILSGLRHAVVSRAFQKLDKFSAGTLPPEVVVREYNSDNHPDVISGIKQASDIRNQFLDNFHAGEEVADRVTRSEFFRYHSNLSESIEDDDYFLKILCGTWGLNEEEFISSKIPSIRSNDADFMDALKKTDLYDFSLRDDRSADNYGGFSYSSKNPPLTPDLGLQMIIRKIRNGLKRRGHYEYVFLERRLRSLKRSEISPIEFMSIINYREDLRLDITSGEFNKLFALADREGIGLANSYELFHLIRDPVRARRQQAVMAVFDFLDNDQDGILSREQINRMFTPSKHPDVIAQKVAADKILKDFLDTFVVGEDIPGKVTRNEFFNYYANIGACVDSDEYFENVIRGVWGYRPNGARDHFNRSTFGAPPAPSSNPTTVPPPPPYNHSYTSAPPGVLPGTSPDPAIQQIERKYAAALPSLRKRPIAPLTVELNGYIRRIRSRLVSNGKYAFVYFCRAVNALSTATWESDGYPPSFSGTARGNRGVPRPLYLMDFEQFKEVIRLTLRAAEIHRRVGYVGNANDLVLTNIELRRMFDFLDVNGVGYIDRDDLIAVVRPVLSDGRKALVRAAIRAVFDPYVDAPGDESLPAKRLLQRVRIERHPDVTAGRVPVHEAYEAFLDTFDVGSEIPYRVSRQEFLDYYTNLSAAVEDDRYFEALIRGVWGLEGGVIGEPQEELSTSLSGAVEHKTISPSSSGQSAVSSPGNDGVSPPGLASARPSDPTTGARLENGTTAAVSDPDRNVYDATLLSSARAENVPPSVSPEFAAVRQIVRRVNASLLSLGQYGFVTAERQLKAQDREGRGTLDLDSCVRALAEPPFSMTSDETALFFKMLDGRKEGWLRIRDLMDAFRKPQSKARLLLIAQTFHQLDTDGCGHLDASAVAKRYRAERHPAVLSGELDSNQVLVELLDTFDVGSEIPYRVSRQEFLDYYTNLSAAVEDDRYFEALIRGVWGLEGGVLGAPQEGLSTSLPAAGPARRGRVHHSTLVFGDDGVLPERNARALIKLNPQKFESNFVGAAVLAEEHLPSSSSSLETSLRTLTNKLRVRGMTSFVEFSRLLRELDEHKNKSIALPQFRKALGLMRVELAEEDISNLFQGFDVRRTGGINVDKLLYRLRGDQQSRRKDWVDDVYTHLDVYGEGMVNIEEMLLKFDPMGHPDVHTGSRSPFEVQNEFVGSFDVGVDIPGKVTRQEFCIYYANIGACLDSDRYFEKVLRGVWRY